MERGYFKPTIENEGLHQDSNYYGVGILNFATSKNLVKSTMFPHRESHKYTWTARDGKTNNQINHILIAGDGIRVYKMYEFSGELTVIPITIWWLQKLREDWQ